MRSEAKLIVIGLAMILLGCALQDFGVMPALAEALEIIGGITVFLTITALDLDE